MNDFEKKIVEQFGQEHLDKVQSVKVGIAGAGGLGSNCAFNLVRSGFKNFKIVDFDKVEYSNLNRQFYFYDQIGQPKVEVLKANLERINPDLNVETEVLRIEESNVKETFQGCDILVEAFDKAESKSLLVESMMISGKFVVSASGLSGIGMSDDIKVNRVNDKLVVVGDLKTDASEKPPISPRVNIAAAKQADVVLEHVLEGLT